MSRARPQALADLQLPHELAADRPKGEQIREHLEALAERLGPGGAMPSDRRLAELFGVARMTVRNEVNQLVGDGVLDVQPGRGTFVLATPRIAYELGASYTLSTSARSKTPGARLLAQSVSRVSDSLARWLEVEPGTEAITIERLRTADGEPVGIERVTLPLARFAGLENVDLERESLYRVLEDNWHVRRVHLEGRAAAVLPSEEDAALLGIPASAPCVSVHITNRDEDGVVFEVGDAIYRGDKYEISVHHDARITAWRS